MSGKLGSLSFEESIDALKEFVALIESRPDVLHKPELAFFRQYVVSLGGVIPKQKPPTTMPTTASTDDGDKPTTPEFKPKSPAKENNAAAEDPTMDEDSDSDSDLEFDMEGCVERDEVPADLEMGDVDKIEVSEEEQDQADEKRMSAMSEFSQGNFDKAIEMFSEAIKLNPKHAILFTKRGQTFLKLNKPMACIHDCTHALTLNADSAPAYKFRGRAFRLIGEWEKAAKDLRQACKIDFDEQADEWLREVQPNAQRIEQHNLKLERKAKDKSDRERLERARKAREAHANVKAAAPQDDGPEDMFGMPNFGNAGGACPAGMGEYMKMFQDPEFMHAFKDPEVSAAFMDIAQNPANIAKYQNNPKVKAFIDKIRSQIPTDGADAPAGAQFPAGAEDTLD